VDLANFAVKYMESFVEYVTFENYQDFIKKDLYKVLLFTDKKSTPPLYKALSKEFKGKLIFGEVR
jgi:protein disulfide-isomerase A6